MRIICEKGFYKFYPQNIGELMRFESKFKRNLVQCEDYFTFPVLAALPNYSIQTHNYSEGNPAFTTYADKREIVMTKNFYTYFIETNNLIVNNSFMRYLNYSVGNFLVFDTLPQAYGIDKNNQKITGFLGFVNIDFMKFNIERFFY